MDINKGYYVIASETNQSYVIALTKLAPIAYASLPIITQNICIHLLSLIFKSHFAALVITLAADKSYYLNIQYVTINSILRYNGR